MQLYFSSNHAQNTQVYLNMINMDFETFKFAKSDIRIKPLSPSHS